MNNVNSRSELILDIANATGEQNIMTLMKEYQNTRKANKEVEEARGHLKALEIKHIIEIKNESVAQIRNKDARVHQLKQLLLESQQEKNNI